MGGRRGREACRSKPTRAACTNASLPCRRVAPVRRAGFFARQILAGDRTRSPDHAHVEFLGVRGAGGARVREKKESGARWRRLRGSLLAPRHAQLSSLFRSEPATYSRAPVRRPQSFAPLIIASNSKPCVQHAHVEFRRKKWGGGAARTCSENARRRVASSRGPSHVRPRLSPIELVFRIRTRNHLRPPTSRFRSGERVQREVVTRSGRRR